MTLEPRTAQYEVVVGFAGGSRATVEVVEAEDRGGACRKATDEHGCTAVAKEIHEL